MTVSSNMELPGTVSSRQQVDARRIEDVAVESVTPNRLESDRQHRLARQRTVSIEYGAAGSRLIELSGIRPSTTDSVIIDQLGSVPGQAASAIFLNE